MRRWATGSYTRVLLVGASTAVLALWATPGATQDTVTEPSVSVDDIIVTATRRASNVLDVPIAISAYGAETLKRAGLSDLKRLQSVSPSLNVTTTQGDSQGAVIRVRGVGTSGSNPGLESATGVSIDGVFRSRSNVALGDLLGISQIELLRGPQGTLFGKNTTAGVLNVMTKKPSFAPEANAAVTLGNYNLQQYEGSVSGPLVGEVLAGRMDALYSRRDGWITSRSSDRTYADRDRYALRGQLLWTPSEDVDVRVIADYSSRDESTANPPTYRIVGPTGALLGALGKAPVAENSPSSLAAHIDDRSPRYDRYEEGGVSAEATWRDLGPGVLTAITAYRDTSAERSFDVEGSPVDLLRDVGDGEAYQTFTQEFRYQGVAGRLDYLFGAFYTHERIESRDGIKTSPLYETYLVGLLGANYLTPFTGLAPGANLPEGSGQTDVFHQTSESLALFTHNTFKLTERLTLTGGLRFTTEEKSLEADLATSSPMCSAAISRFGAVLTGVPASLKSVLCSGFLDERYNGNYRDSRSESEWSGVVSAGYRFADKLNGYVSYSRGYKGGGYQFDRTGMLFTGPDAAQLAFNPEFADAYEAGLKGVFFDGAVRANAAVFYSRITDYQFNYLKVLPLQTARVTANLPELTSQGVELDGLWRVTPSWAVSGAATWNRVRYGKDGFPTELAQLEGTMAPYAPEWSLTASVNYDRAIPGTDLEAFVYLDANWRSEANLSFSGTTTREFYQDGYALANLRIGLGRQDGQWSAEVFARNLFDKSAWTGLYVGTAQTGSVEGFFMEPRFYGITLRSRWGG